MAKMRQTLYNHSTIHLLAVGSRQECTAPGERVWDAATVSVESKEVAISVRWLSEVIRCWVLGRFFLFIYSNCYFCSGNCCAISHF